MKPWDHDNEWNLKQLESFNNPKSHGIVYLNNWLKQEHKSTQWVSDDRTLFVPSWMLIILNKIVRNIYIIQCIVHIVIWLTLIIYLGLIYYYSFNTAADSSCISLNYLALPEETHSSCHKVYLSLCDERVSPETATMQFCFYVIDQM